MGALAEPSTCHDTPLGSNPAHVGQLVGTFPRFAAGYLGMGPDSPCTSVPDGVARQGVNALHLSRPAWSGLGLTLFAVRALPQ